MPGETVATIEAGGGVSIVIALADEYGSRPETLPPATAPGKAVWFLFKRDFAAVTPAPATSPVNAARLGAG